jgi:integrase
MKLPFIKAYKDRHGRARYYFRRKGYSAVQLPAPHAPGFMAAYEAANSAQKFKIDASKIGFLRGTLGWGIDQFVATKAFNARAPNTWRSDRRIFDELKRTFGGGMLRDLRPRHVKAMRDHFHRRFSASVADSALGRLSVLWQFADQHLDLELEANPTVGVSRLHGHREENERQPWSEELFAAFDAAAPAHLRLAVMLGRYTGQRRSDVVKMKWSQFDGETIEVVQQKTGEFVVIPCHIALRAVLQSIPRKGKFILLGERGNPYDPASLSRLVRQQLQRLGIKGYSFHGLRKNAAQALAEAGCSIDEIMAVTGHRSAKMALHYTKRAAKKQMAKNAIKRWEIHDEQKRIKRAPGKA